jgi:putative intracellular protease/amidase
VKTEEDEMKKILTLSFLAMTAAMIVLSCGRENDRKVLIIARRGGESLDSFLTAEIPLMTRMLKDSGYSFVIASDSMDPIKGYSSTLPVDLMISEVVPQDYKGVLIPCLGSKEAPEAAVAIVRRALLASKPIASADGGLIVLSKAAALTNRRYAATRADVGLLDEKGIFSGEGVVQDGLVITAGTCCLDMGTKDGTPELMRLFLSSLKASR